MPTYELSLIYFAASGSTRIRHHKQKIKLFTRSYRCELGWNKTFYVRIFVYDGWSTNTMVTKRQLTAV
jgi:hypothetical protein